MFYFENNLFSTLQPICAYFLFLNFSIENSWASWIRGLSFSKVSSNRARTEIHPIHAYTGYGMILSVSVKSNFIFTTHPESGRAGMLPNIFKKLLFASQYSHGIFLHGSSLSRYYYRRLSL